jgi:hypothetical protein
MNGKLNPLKNLLNQRKFWMAFLGIIAATIMLATGQIDPHAWLDAVMVIILSVIGGNVAEDIAIKWGK